MEVYLEKMDGTPDHAHDAVYRPFFRGIPPSTEILLQWFLYSPEAQRYISMSHTVDILDPPLRIL